MEDFVIAREIKPTKWTNYFLKMAVLVASQSQDRSTKCGCVIVSHDNRVLSTGYNGFPTGTEDYDNEAKHERPEKYLWFEHSERNAIYSAAKHGTSLEGSTAYITGPPCVDCTRAMVQCGVAMVIIPVKHNMQGRKDISQKWIDQARTCEAIMTNANVHYYKVEVGD